VALAAVQVTETSPTIPVITADRILDIRGFYHATLEDARDVFHTKATPADWLINWNDVARSLDELASRMASSAIPNDIKAFAPNAGVSLVAAREDHSHQHGDVSGFFTVHHGADQIDYAPGNLAHWAGGVDPGLVRDALDQLASRVDALEP
jgi:hypothetical protein